MKNSINFYLLVILTLNFFIISTDTYSQNTTKEKHTLSIFLDCNGTWCDEDYIRTEITAVNHSRDRIASDLHILLTANSNASQGRTYQVIFYGQRTFKGMIDTLSFSTPPNSTDFEIREQISSYLKLGLVPFLIKNGTYESITVNLKKSSENDTVSNEELQDDKWNYWVFTIGGNGSINADKNYQSYNFGGNINARRITETRKLGFSYNENLNQNNFVYEDAGIEIKQIVKNNSREFNHYNNFAINDHWSMGYTSNYQTETFSNYKSKITASPGIEYSIFPYKEFNTKLVTLSYFVGVSNIVYVDTTIYNKTKEFLPFHRLSFDTNLTQKWGNINVGINYNQFLHNLKFYNLNIFSQFEVRIKGGLSIYSFIYGGLARDQINLVRDSPDPTEVLTRQRELQSAYNIGAHFGINYRFGSKLNNFVNPRLGGGGGQMFFF